MNGQSHLIKSIPVLETDRLLLRAHKREDLSACTEMWSHPTVIRHTIVKPSSEQRTWMRMLGYLGHWQMLGYGYWAIEEKSSSQFIGEIGFADFKRNLTPSIDGIPEAGWVLSPRAHGKGFVKEALQAALDWADSTVKFAKTVCLISPENQVSIKLAQKFNYLEYTRSTKENAEDSLIFFQRLNSR